MNPAPTESEVEKVQESSEALIQEALTLQSKTNQLFKDLGITKGATRQVLYHPSASNGLRRIGLFQSKAWQEEVGEILKQGTLSEAAKKRKKTSRKLLAI